MAPSGGDFSETSEQVTCRQFVELVTDYFEGTLEPKTLSPGKGAPQSLRGVHHLPGGKWT